MHSHTLRSLLLLTLCSLLRASPDFAAWSTAPPGADQVDRLQEETRELREQSAVSLYRMAAGESEFISHGRPQTEWAAWRLSHLYRLTGDPDAARSAAALLGGLASRELPVPPKRIHIEGKWIPYPAVLAWDLIEEADIWPVKISEQIPAVTRDALDSWLDDITTSFIELLHRPGQVTNYTPFGLRHAAALALISDHAELMHLCLHTAMELAFSPEFWYADHIWQEGTVSYARQVTGNLKALLPMLEAGKVRGWIDPQDTDLERLGQRLREIDQTQFRFSMPSGRPIPVHDTHWRIPPDSLPRAPRALAFPDFGHYTLPGGDVELHLSLPLLTGGGRYGGGHQHDSRLALQLWAHGQELLPDAGYPFQPANHRYFHMSPYSHNTAVALDRNATYAPGPYGVWNGDWARTSLLGYDDGSDSDGTVGWLCATSPGPVSDGVSEQTRALLQVKTGEWTVYVVDVFWLRGGQLHRWFLRQSEDEPMQQSVSAALTPEPYPHLAAVLGEVTEGDLAWTTLLQSPLRVEEEAGFQLTWTGEESGVGLHVFLAAQPGAASWLSRMPRLRPTQQNPQKRDDFPGWHLLRQREVTPQELTLWAAVYEPVPAGKTGTIESVNWERSGDGVGIRLTVQLKTGRTDTWYLGLPGNKGMTVEATTLIGSAAGFSKTGSRIDWTWASAGSVLSSPELGQIRGPDPVKAQVQKLTSHGSSSRLELQGDVELPENTWGLLCFADSSGRALQLGPAAKTGPDTTVFLLPEDPAIRVDSTGLMRIAFPPHRVPGKVTFQRLGGSFTRKNSSDITSD